MKQNDKHNIVAAIQKNMKLMQIEAHNYIEKHHTALPPLCSARHYLFHSLNKRNTIDLMTERRTSPSQTIQDSKNSINSKATVYNIEFRKKIFNQEKKGLSTRNMFNSTSMKMKINGGWKPARSIDYDANKSIIQNNKDEKMKTIFMNSQVISLTDRDLISNYNSFSPKGSKTDLSKKQVEMLNKYINRFKGPKNQVNSPKQKKQKKMKKKKKNSIMQQQLEKNQQPEQEFISQQLLMNTDPIKKRQRLTIRYEQIEDPQKQLILIKRKPRIESIRRKIQQKKQKDIEYTPWQSSQNYNIQDYMGSVIF